METITASQSAPGAIAPEMHKPSMHMPEMPMPPEMMALFDLVPLDQATHTAVRSGSWFDPNTWQNGQIPGDDARVVIAAGVQVRYDSQSEARLKTLRVDGSLSFATNQNTKLVVDTFVNGHTGELTIGTEDNPVEAGVSTEIVFTSEGAIDRQWDPKLLSRGLVSHGKVNIHGAEKDDFLTLQQDAGAGDRELILSQVPTGWQIGDKLVLGGTQHQWGKADETNDRFQDEELIITGISGNRVTFINANITEGDNTILRFDHQRPEGFEDQLNLYVANTSRNITFETENASGIANSRRAHIMFMHNPDVMVKNAGFYNLGRSDKNKLVDDVGENKDGRDGGGTNPRGRYALHFHRTGAEGWDGQAAIAQGNAVVGSPGWGIVHHDSHAILEDNVVFDVVGAGIVAEVGNEIGAWRNNLTIKTTGDDDSGLGLGFRDTRVENFDFGFNGEGYWVQGAAQIEITDNAAVSAAGGGINIFGGGDGGETARDKKKIAVANLPEQYRNIAQGTDDETMIDVSAVPILKVAGFESYNSLEGISSWTRLRNKDGQLQLQFDSEGETRPAHNYRSTIEDFKVWNIYGTGVRLEYSGNVDLKDGLVLGRDAYGSGIHTNHAATKQRFSNLQVEGFKQGIRVPLDVSVEFVGSVLENTTLRNNEVNFAVTPDQRNRTTGEQIEDFSAFFQIRDGNQFEAAPGNVAPTPEFAATGAGGLAVTLDAGASYDGDSERFGQQASNGIVSYGWDLNGDGRIDRYGRQLRPIFGEAGTYNIGLTVWDEQGASTSMTRAIAVTPTPFDNPFVDGSFSNAKARVESWQSDSAYGDRGWFTTDQVSTDGRLRLSNPGTWGGGAGQILRDETIRRGIQTLSFDLKNTEGDDRPWRLNQINVRLYGVNGQFNNTVWEPTGPSAAGILPMQSQTLLDTQLGGESFDWRNFQWEVDLGSGYDYLLFQVNTEATADERDDVAIDNVALIGEGGSVLGNSGSLPEPPAPPPVTPPAVPAEVESAILDFVTGMEGESVATRIAAIANNLIDLRQVDLDNDGQIDEQVEITLADVASSAGYNNAVGFYEVVDVSGAIVDQMTGQLLLPEDEGYAATALRQHLSGVQVLRDSGEVRFGASGGGLLGSFLVADGTIADIMAQNPANQPGKMQAYFAIQAANSDGASHVRNLGGGRLGFEDLWGGGDNDFNDFMFGVEVGLMG